MKGMVLVAEGDATPHLSGIHEGSQGYALMREPQTNVHPTDILAAYHQWGDACARHLCGDFAFVLWDAQKGCLLAARSITGRCPLYIAQLSHGLCWTSDPPALLDHVSEKADLAWRAGWLLRSEDGWDCSPWQAIRPVLPGHTLIYEPRSGHLRMDASWIPPSRLSVNDLPFAEAVERFRSLFLQAIETRLQGHHQVSFDCSGGLDSSSIVASCASLQEQGRLPHGPLPALHGYSERFPEEDGRSYLRALTSRYPAILPQFLDYDAVCQQPLVVQEAHYPTTQTILLPAFFQERARQITSMGSTLHLSGEFGDHLFAPTIRWLWHQHPWRVARELMEWRSISSPRHLLYRAWLSERSARQSRQQPPCWIAQEIIEWDQHHVYRREQLLQRWLPDPFQRALIGRILRDQALFSLAGPPHIVTFPYLDQALLEFFCACPLPWLMAPWQRPKALLRAAMQDILPEPIRGRTDKGNATRIVAFWSRHQSAALKTIAEQLSPLPWIDWEGLISAITRMSYGDCRDQRFISAALALALCQRGGDSHGND